MYMINFLNLFEFNHYTELVVREVPLLLLHLLLATSGLGSHLAINHTIVGVQILKFGTQNTNHEHCPFELSHSLWGKFDFN